MAEIRPRLQKPANDWTKTHHQTILTLDFEAAIHLAHWPSLSSLIDEAKDIVSPRLSAIFMNAVLSSDAPVREILRVVKVRVASQPAVPLPTHPPTRPE